MTVTGTNPILHVEIPVARLERATRFYEAVFGWRFDPPTIVHGHPMAYLPHAEGTEGASLALAQGDVYVPSNSGAIVYFRVTDIDVTLQRATALGSEILFPKTAIDPEGFVAEIADSEGNRIALQTV
ncbi:VOC family protein [Sphingomonas sp. T9W2]|uniref:VOC family protein n=1 Tax=Sphingomonas sp. T9W2 TaxID=3143183 RepID=UPI0031F52D1D